MTDPPRLIDHEADDLERDMLLAGLRDGPSSSRRRAIAAGLGVGFASIVSFASAAKASVATASKASAPHSVSWLSHLVIGGTIGVAAIAAGVSFWPAAEPTATVASPARPALAAPARPAAPQPPAAELEEPAPNLPEPAPARPSSVTASRATPESAPPRAPSLSDELALLETARRALVRGEPRRTLSLLDEHAHSLKKPRLRTEASVLRIEALVANGERARATRLGKDFLARHANGPYERRVRSLIGDERSTTSRSP